jgi:hypothetical protein
MLRIRSILECLCLKWKPYPRVVFRKPRLVWAFVRIWKFVVCDLRPNNQYILTKVVPPEMPVKTLFSCTSVKEREDKEIGDDRGILQGKIWRLIWKYVNHDKRLKIISSSLLRCDIVQSWKYTPMFRRFMFLTSSGYTSNLTRKRRWKRNPPPKR